MSRWMHVYSFGMSCPVGRRALPACAAIRGGINRRIELPFLDSAKRPITGSRAAFVEVPGRLDRIAVLMLDALRDALGEQLCQLADTPVIFAIPATLALTRVHTGRFIERVAMRLGVRLNPSRVFVVGGEGSAAFEAVISARALLSKGNSAVIVCAADSLVCAESLLELSDQGRLLVEGNPDGVVPGEAAACVVLGMARYGTRTTIQGIGVAEEPGLLNNDVPLRAEGICRATRTALQQADMTLDHPDFRVSDAAGESYAFKEQSLLMSRLLRKRKAEFPLWLTASELGDTGTAAGLIGLVMAVRGFEAGYAPGDSALVFGGGMGAKRAAIVCSRP